MVLRRTLWRTASCVTPSRSAASATVSRSIGVAYSLAGPSIGRTPRGSLLPTTSWGCVWHVADLEFLYGRIEQRARDTPLHAGRHSRDGCGDISPGADEHSVCRGAFQNRGWRRNEPNGTSINQRVTQAIYRTTGIRQYAVERSAGERRSSHGAGVRRLHLLFHYRENC